MGEANERPWLASQLWGMQSEISERDSQQFAQ